MQGSSCHEPTSLANHPVGLAGPMPRIPWILATVLAYISLVAGCTSATRTSPGTGLVSLHPSITSTLVSLGAAEQLVGRSAHCSEPEVSRLPAMGHELAPTLEPLAALHPEAILVSGSEGARLDQLGALAPVESYPWLDVAQMVQSVRALGRRTGTVDAADRLAAKLEQGLTGPAKAHAPSALLIISTEADGSVWFMQPNSIHGAALRAGGFANAVSETVTGPPRMGVEELLRRDPEHLILLVDATADIEAATAPISALRPLAAVQQQRVHVLAGAFLGTGPEILELAERIGKIPR